MSSYIFNFISSQCSNVLLTVASKQAIIQAVEEVAFALTSVTK